MSSQLNIGSNIGVIVLAAGASTRMGTPKQLLLYQGRSLLRHTVEIAISSSCQPIIVVLGAQIERISPQLDALPVQVVENPIWSTGMGSSIQVGMEAILKINPDLEAVIILLCDQPLISLQLIIRLIASYRKTAKTIVACEYDMTVGVPALFSYALFPQLRRLTGQSGAKQVIRQHHNEIVRLPFPGGKVDVDTPSDYERLEKIGRR